MRKEEESNDLSVQAGTGIVDDLVKLERFLMGLLATFLCKPSYTVCSQPSCCLLAIFLTGQCPFLEKEVVEVVLLWAMASLSQCTYYDIQFT